MEQQPTTTAAQEAVRRYFGIDGKAYPLAGEVDYNFRIEAPDGVKYTLKWSRGDIDRPNVDLQLAMIRYLADADFPYALPRPVPTREGKDYATLPDGRLLRLQHWVAGQVLDSVRPRTPELYADWGRLCGQLSARLQHFDHPAAHRFYRWNPSEVLHTRQHREHIADAERLATVDYFWELFENEVLPQLPALRASVNYNDAHEHNVLITAEDYPARVTGLIDFGDAIYTQTVNELAIACAYAGMHCPDPLTAMATVVRGYHAEFSLQEREVAVLFPLIAARLVISAATAAFNRFNEPANEYLVISERPAWELLTKLRRIDPTFAHYRFRAACGWEPCPQRAAFAEWVQSREEDLIDLIDWQESRITPLDLSVGSLDLGINTNFTTIGAFERTIDRILAEADADVGVGGYNEVRPVYTTEAYQVEGNNGAQWRTTHLGLDVWAPAGTPVRAPLSGTVHSVHDNAGERDYGPTIILEHRPTPDLVFYTLYGHLSRASLPPLRVGDSIRAGQEFCAIGPAPENGNWPPHLHFQIIMDLLGNQHDFPGVAYPHEIDTWLSVCPDPALFFPALPKVSTSASTAAAILAARSRWLGRSLSVSYESPLHIVRGFGQHLYDVSGRRYLDTVNNVPHVGHQHPRVVRAAQRQLAVLNTNTRYLHDEIVAFAQELAATLPESLSVVHFVNSGSEANELALRMAPMYTGQRDMLAIEVGYHGNTGACIAVSSYKFDGKGGQGAPPHTHVLPLPDSYRGRHRDPATAGQQYAAYAEPAIAAVRAAGRGIAGLIHESILSCGGQIVPPEGYLSELYRIVRAAGGLCIADEVQTGFGRVGERFWAFELQGVVPDIVTLGKPIGNGHPLGAVVTTPEIATAFANGMEYFNTFGGNPVSSTIGREVLRVVHEEGLQQHAREIGQYLTAGLQELQSRYPLIGDVRGPGLFLGFELVRDPETREPAPAAAHYLANRMRERAILMSTDGPDHNVLKIKPPLCFSRADVDFLLSNLDRVLGESYLQRLR